MTCSIKDCASPAKTKGLCSKHYQRQWLLGDANTSVRPSSGTCLHCKRPVTNATARPKIYCSRACSTAAGNARQKAKSWPHKPRPHKPQQSLKCADCGTIFESARAAARYCSTACSRRYIRNHQPPCSQPNCDRPRLAHGLCKGCNKKRLRRAGMYPSEAWTDARRDGYHRRRAQKRATATSQPVLLAYIAERDKWLCGICRKPVRRNCKYPDRMSPTLDHVIPLSLGGLHQTANVQLAHFACNSSKGAKLVEQPVLLFG